MDILDGMKRTDDPAEQLRIRRRAKRVLVEGQRRAGIVPGRAEPINRLQPEPREPTPDRLEPNRDERPSSDRPDRPRSETVWSEHEGCDWWQDAESNPAESHTQQVRAEPAERAGPSAPTNRGEGLGVEGTDTQSYSERPEPEQQEPESEPPDGAAVEMMQQQRERLREQWREWLDSDEPPAGPERLKIWRAFPANQQADRG